jgi:hypothetical protein
MISFPTQPCSSRSRVAVTVTRSHVTDCILPRKVSKNRLCLHQQKEIKNPSMLSLKMTSFGIITTLHQGHLRLPDVIAIMPNFALVF